MPSLTIAARTASMLSFSYSCFAIHISAEYTSSANRTVPEMDMPRNSVKELRWIVRQ